MICWYNAGVSIYTVTVYAVYVPFLAGKARQRTIDRIQCIIRRIIRISDREFRCMPALPGLPQKKKKFSALAAPFSHDRKID